MWPIRPLKSLVAMVFVSTVCLAAAGSQRSEKVPRPLTLIAAFDERLAVLSSADGRESPMNVPMIALSDRGGMPVFPGKYTEVSNIAVTADGRSIIVVNGVRDCRTTGGFEAGSYQPEMDQVVMETGKRERVSGGADFPVVNAKGVVASSGICDGAESLGFTDLVTGQNARSNPFGEEESERQSVTRVRPLAWLRDGRTLFYEVSMRGETRPRYYFGLLWPFVPSKAQRVRRVAAAMQGSGSNPTAVALVDDATIAFAQGGSAGSRIREWDVATQKFLGVDRGFQLPETVTALTVDPSGNHFLAVTRSRMLYRWSVGDAAPTPLASGVRAAAWIL